MTTNIGGEGNPSAFFSSSKETIMKPAELATFLSFCITNHFPPIIKGRPGIGKSDIVGQASQTANARLIISHPVVSDPTDYKGLPFAKDDKMAYFLPYGELHEILHTEEETIFFLDDLGQATPAVQAACMQLILARRINGHIVSDKVTFAAATNRKEDKAGVSGILEPLKSRFISIIELEVKVDDWVKWALKNNMPIELIAFVQTRPDYIEKFEPNKDIVNSSSPRTVANVGLMQNNGLPAALEFEAFKGAAGEDFATEYRTYLKVYRKLPAIDQIILSPGKAIVPVEPDLLYAVGYALSKRATAQNFPAISTYLKRIPIEYAIASIKGATERDNDLCNTRTFKEWASDNTGVFI